MQQLKNGTHVSIKYDFSGKNNPMYGKFHTEETKKIISIKCGRPSKYKGLTLEEKYGERWPEIRKKMSISHKGKPGYKGDLNPGKRQDVREKMSLARRGVKHPWFAGSLNPACRQEVREKISSSKLGSKVSDETKKKISNTIRMQYINGTRNLGWSKTKTEQRFEQLLINNSIKYIYQWFIPCVINNKSTVKFFDFKVEDKNILVEIDGDYWHCNTSIGIWPKKEYQIKNIENDRFKENLSKSNGYKLYRFWQYDIWNKENEVERKLLDILEIEK